MKKLILILTVLGLTGCGIFKDQTALQCSVMKVHGISTINCPDGSSTEITDGVDGADGSQGNNGLAGANGHSIVTSIIPISSCPAGGYTLVVATDSDDNGHIDMTDGNIQSAEICNGVDGNNGTNGLDAAPTPFTPVGIVDPCGTNPSLHNEVFIKLSNGTLLASFSDNISGYNTRFSVLTPGTYQTTDGDACVFTVDSQNNIVAENHHF